MNVFVFAPTKDVPYITKIAEVTPDEYDALRKGTFPNLSLLSKSGGRSFLKLLRVAITEFESIAI